MFDCERCRAECIFTHISFSDGISTAGCGPPRPPPTQSDAELQWGMIQMGEPGAPWKSAKVRDLWAHENLGTFAGSFVFKGLEPHAAAFLVVTEA